MRMLLLVALCMATSVASAQDGMGAIFAWNGCKQARATNHAITVDGQPAINAYAKAAAAVAAVDARYRDLFSTRLQQIRNGIDAASTAEGKGVGLRATADGQYGVIKARIASGNWLGVEAAAKACRDTYYKSSGYLEGASQGYGGAQGAAEDLEREAIQFQAMLEAFEDFYGPTSGY